MLTLVREMGDLDHLARLPATPFTAGLAASTDRRSRRPEDGASWFANDDFVTDENANLVRVEPGPDGGKRYVLLDEEGPGAILRIWSATPTGTLRLYIDGDPHPALEAPMGALLAGEVSPFAAPLAAVTARGYNLYFPFPFRRRCVVTVDSIVSPDPFTGRDTARFFYQIGYRRYAPAAGQHVRSYAPSELARAAGAIGRIATLLRDGPPAPGGNRPGLRTIAVGPARLDRDHPIALTIPAPRGGGRVVELRLQTSDRAIDRLRATRLSIAFDGEETVRAPLVDFFGTGPEPAPFRTLPVQVDPDGALVCRFPMPFRRQAVLAISRAAAGSADVGGRVTIDAAPFDRDTLLFHAGWRPREVLRTRPLRDWHVATIEGIGHQVGTVLNVENPPGTAWWGEGDEKIRIDGDAFPTLFGTGTEDYFGYAWSQTETFSHAYHAQSRAPADGFGGLFSMNRFLVLDPVPFTRSLRFDLEIWHWTDTAIAADATIYWYARPGGRDDLAPRRP